MTRFDIFEFNYYDKETGQGFIVYARSEETANKIIEIVNDQNIYYFVKPKFKRFKVPCKTDISPYELETEQFDTATKQMEQRLNFQQEVAKKKIH